MAQAMNDGLCELCKYTLARQGHRALMDALISFVECFNNQGDFEAACSLARAGALDTKHMTACLGRASYIEKQRLDEGGGVPDPSALGVVSILEGLSNALAKSRNMEVSLQLQSDVLCE